MNKYEELEGFFSSNFKALHKFEYFVNFLDILRYKLASTYNVQILVEESGVFN